MIFGRAREPGPTDAVPVWGAAAVLLDYPTEALLASLDAVERLVPGHPQLGGVIAHLRATPLRQLQEDYVETFDHTRKCALYLTYFAYGDTRRRGQALVAFNARHDGIVMEADGKVILTAANPDVATADSPSFPAIVNHVVYFGDGVSEHTKLVGFTITGAKGFVQGPSDLQPVESIEQLDRSLRGEPVV